LGDEHTFAAPDEYSTINTIDDLDDTREAMPALWGFFKPQGKEDSRVVSPNLKFRIL